MLVLKQEGEKTCAVGVRCGGDLAPGEVLIHAGQGTRPLSWGTTAR